MTTVADALVDALEAHGIDTIVGIGETHAARPFERRGSMRFVAARTEFIAVTSPWATPKPPGHRIHAIVQVSPDTTEADLRDHIAGQLARYKNPRSYELVDHPLRDDAGKVRKSELVKERTARDAEESS